MSKRDRADMERWLRLLDHSLEEVRNGRWARSPTNDLQVDAMMVEIVRGIRSFQCQANALRNSPSFDPRDDRTLRGMEQYWEVVNGRMEELYQAYYQAERIH